MPANTAALRSIMLSSTRCRAAASSSRTSMPCTSSIRRPRPQLTQLLSHNNHNHVRAFTTTNHYSKNSIGPLPTFAPTSNQPLDALLDTLRSELFIPPHLLERHRLLIYRRKNHHILQEEPLYYDIGSQTVQLLPKTTVPGLPKFMFTRAVSLMKAPEDFNAIPKLVLGYAQSGRHLKDKHIKKAVRAASLNGRPEVLLQILDQVQWNGVRVTLGIAREAFRGFALQTDLGSKLTALRAGDRARRLLKLISQQDSVVQGEYTSRAAKISKDQGLTEAGVKKELGPPPSPISKDPLCLGYLAGLEANISMQYFDSLDYKSHCAYTTQSLLNEKIWKQCMDKFNLNDSSQHKQFPFPISSNPQINELAAREQRQLFHDTFGEIAELEIFLNALKKVIPVLTNTSKHITEILSSSTTSSSSPPPINPTILNPESHFPLPDPKNPTKNTLFSHTKLLNSSTILLLNKIPQMEQVLEKWKTAMVEDAKQIMEWDENEWKWRMEGKVNRYIREAERLRGMLEVERRKRAEEGEKEREGEEGESYDMDIEAVEGERR